MPVYLLKYCDNYGFDRNKWNLDKLYAGGDIEDTIVPFPESRSYDLPELKSLDVDLVDHCNLNCRGCGHMSNVADEGFMSLDVFENDITRISSLYSRVKLLQLLGGEPLLHPYYDKIMEISRKIMPLSDICVYSNGLMIPSVPDKFLNAMRENRIYFMITQYPPVSKLLPSITARLDEFGVAYWISDLKDKFFAGFLKKPHDSRMSFAKCPHRCYSLYNGFISVCTGDVLLERNRKHLKYIKHNLKSGRINIYDEELTGEILNRLLEMPIPLCAFCEGANPRWFDWHCGGVPEAKDWLMDES